MKRFWRHLQCTVFWRNRSFQFWVLLFALLAVIVMTYCPAVAEPLQVILVGFVCIGGPLTVLGIYDGLFHEDDP